MERVIRDFLADPSKYQWSLLVIVVLGGLAAAWLVQRLRVLRYGVPLQIKSVDRLRRGSASPDERGPDLEIKLQTEVIAFIADDPSRRLAPGSMHRVEPHTLPGAGASPWISALLVIWSVVTRRPTLEVTLDQLTSPNPHAIAVAVRVSKQPGGRVVAAQTFTASVDGHLMTSESELLQDIAGQIGAFCLNRVRRQRFVARRTPPWERWTSDTGYLEYRKGLRDRRAGLDLRAAWKAEKRQIERREAQKAAVERGEPVVSDELSELRLIDLPSLRVEHDRNRVESTRLLGEALRHFSTASRHDRANVLPRLAAASLRELLDEFWSAIGLYAFCRVQWPALVEPRYRLLATVDKQQLDPDTCRQRAKEAHDEIREALKLSTVIRMRLRRRGLGRYAGRLLHKRRVAGLPFTALSRRRQLLLGAKAARLAVLMWNVAAVNPDGSRRVEAARARKEVLDLFRSQAKLHGLGRRAPISALLHQPDVGWWSRRLSDPDDHDLRDHRAMIQRLTFVTRHRRGRNVGWMARYNTACFFSFASELPADVRPWTSNDVCWIEDCVAAASREIRRVFGDPDSELDPDWTDDDPDLESVRKALRGETLPRELRESMRWVLG